MRARARGRHARGRRRRGVRPRGRRQHHPRQLDPAPDREPRHREAGSDQRDHAAEPLTVPARKGAPMSVQKSALEREKGWTFDLIDLTRPLTEQTAYALLGDIAAGEENKHYSQVAVTYDREWSTSNGTLCHLSMPDHVGTHMDAPIHCWEPGVSLEQVKIE